MIVALQGLRLLVGTVGGELRSADYAAVLVGAVIAGSRPEGWMIIVLLVAAVLAAQPRLYPFLLPGILATGALSAAIFDASIPNRIQVGGYWIWRLVVLIAIVVSLQVSTVRTTTDIGRQPLSVTRLRLGRALAGLVVMGALLSSPFPEGVTVLGPAPAALMASGLVTALAKGAVDPGL